MCVDHVAKCVGCVVSDGVHMSRCGMSLTCCKCKQLTWFVNANECTVRFIYLYIYFMCILVLV